MKLISTLSALLASAVVVAATSDQTSMLTLRLHSSLNTHYENTQQVPSTSKGSLLHIAVGTNLSFDHAPILVQGIEIANINKGMDLSSPPRLVEEDSEDVVCKAQIGFSSNGVEFRMEEGIVSLGEGSIEKVTGLSCWLA